MVEYSQVKLIAGLGNPGTKYQNTRHNLGFIVADSFVKGEGFSWRISRDWICYYAKTNEFVIIKPSTFMNKSGEAVRSVAEFFKIDVSDILVIHDDLDLQFGKIRISFDSMSAGHKGIESVIKSLSGPDFARLRVGIGRPTPKATDGKGDPKKYVLEEFTKDEMKHLPEILEMSIEAIRSYLSDGVQAAMNRFN